MLQKLSIRHLRTLRVLYETKSMRETSQRVLRSQPAVSLQIKDLEEILGFRLVYHKKGAISFTEQGARFVEAAKLFERQLTEEIDSLRSARQGTTRFGVTHDIYASCADQLLTLNDYGIELLPMTSGEVIQGCHRRELALGIAKTERPIKDAARTWTCGLNWAGRYPVAAKAKPIELVLLEAGCFYHHLALKLFENAAPDAIELVICDDWDQIGEKLSDGGVTIVSSQWAQKLGTSSDKSYLPQLPGATMNLIRADQNEAAANWAADRLASVVTKALGGHDASLGSRWLTNRIKVWA